MRVCISVDTHLCKQTICVLLDLNYICISLQILCYSFSLYISSIHFWRQVSVGTLWCGGEKPLFFRPLILLCKCRVHKSCLLLFTTMWFMRPSYSNKAEQGERGWAMLVMSEGFKGVKSVNLVWNLRWTWICLITCFRLFVSRMAHVKWLRMEDLNLTVGALSSNESPFCCTRLIVKLRAFISPRWIQEHTWQTEIFTYLLSLWNKTTLQQTHESTITLNQLGEKCFSDKACWIITSES